MFDQLRHNNSNYINRAKVAAAAVWLGAAAWLTACKAGESTSPTGHPTISDSRQSLSDLQIKNTIRIFEKLKDSDSAAGKTTNSVKLCFTDGNPKKPAEYTCPMQIDLRDLAYYCPSVDRSDPGAMVRNSAGSRYCESTNTIVVTHHSLTEWGETLGQPEASAFVVAHELGHVKQKDQGLLEAYNNHPIPMELHATCLAGVSLKEAHPTYLAGINQAMKKYTTVESAGPRGVHGAIGEQMAALNQGAQTGNCDIQKFTTQHS